MIFAPDSLRTDQDSDGGDDRHWSSPLFSGNSNWSGGSRLCPFFSCFVGQPLSFDALKREVRALRVIDAKLGAGIHAEIELGQVTVKMLGVDMLIHADNASLENREKAFKRIGMHVAACPFVLGMVNGFVLRRLIFEYWRTIRHQAAFAVKLAVEQAANAAMVNDHGADRAAAFDEAQDANILRTLATGADASS